MLDLAIAVSNGYDDILLEHVLATLGNITGPDVPWGQYLEERPKVPQILCRLLSIGGEEGEDIRQDVALQVSSHSV